MILRSRHRRPSPREIGLPLHVASVRSVARDGLPSPLHTGGHCDLRPETDLKRSGTAECAVRLLISPTSIL